MVQLNVGDDVILCASIKDYCGISNAYLIRDINISPPPCNITAFIPDCLNLSGIDISFGWTIKSDPPLNECPTMLSGVLGSATTNAQGVASVQYRITQQDLDLYNANLDSFDLAACITNSPIDIQNEKRKKFRAADPIIIGADLCIGSPCQNRGVVSECFGADMWWVKCDPATGTCVQDILRQANHPVCLGATHVLELTIKPHSWYTPQGAADELISKMNDINGAIMNAMSFLTGWSYVGTVISTDANYVYLKVYMRENIPALTLGNIALVVIPLAVIVGVVGTFVISATKWGILDAPVTGLTNGDLTNAIDKYMKKELDDCRDVKCVVDPPLTQDQKASCIKVCMENELDNVKGLLSDILPDADTTPLDVGITDIQNCYDIYNSSEKTEADFQAVSECMGRKAKEGVTGTTTNINITYPPDAPAGVTKDDLAAEDCWISSPISTGCILTAKTGKTIAIVSGVVIVGYLIFSLIRK